MLYSQKNKNREKSGKERRKRRNDCRNNRGSLETIITCSSLGLIKTIYMCKYTLKFICIRIRKTKLKSLELKFHYKNNRVYLYSNWINLISFFGGLFQNHSSTSLNSSLSLGLITALYVYLKS